MTAVTLVFRCKGAEVVLATITDWQRRAACRGPQSEVFYPPAKFERKIERRERERLAKAICASCGVQGTCLNDAVVRDEQHGIWGGLNEGDRKASL